MEQFTIRTSWLDSIGKLSDSERGRLFTALCEYAKTGEAKKLCGNEKVVYPGLVKEIDAERAGLVQKAQNFVQIAQDVDKRDIYITQPSEEGIKNSRYLLSAMFEEFWRAYPVHVNKKRCTAIWDKLKPDEELLSKMLDRIEQWKKTRQWKEGYIPYPDTWLRNEKWEDEAPPDYTMVRMNNRRRERDPFFNYDEKRNNNSHIQLIELSLDDL